ncbi:MAG: hypothetical protein KI792_07770 [Alphaproteobacteria bacterium]|nr:hypothetical protein [Alphaproteobacteria bacterium SS10]
MLVIDFYTKRLLGPKEIAQRAAYQPQIVLPEPWLSSDYDPEIIDDRDEPEGETGISGQAAWIPDRPRQEELSNYVPRGAEAYDGNLGKQPDAEERQQLDDYARWIARGRYRRQQAEQQRQASANANVTKAPSNTSLQDPADELRRAAKRLRDLAQELRSARLDLTGTEKRQDQP